MKKKSVKRILLTALAVVIIAAVVIFLILRNPSSQKATVITGVDEIAFCESPLSVSSGEHSDIDYSNITAIPADSETTTEIGDYFPEIPDWETACLLPDSFVTLSEGKPVEAQLYFETASGEITVSAAPGAVQDTIFGTEKQYSLEGVTIYINDGHAAFISDDCLFWISWNAEDGTPEDCLRDIIGYFLTHPL